MDTTSTIAGLLEPGNIDLHNRPVVHNPDGSISTVRSISINEDGQEVLIPTVSPSGTVLSNDGAVALYHQTGKHLGRFKDVASADAYAQSLHDQQAAEYLPPQQTDQPSQPAPWQVPAPSAQETHDAAAAIKQQQDNYSWSQFGQDIMNFDWATTQSVLGEHAPPMDPHWHPTKADFEMFRKNVPEYMWDRIDEAQSAKGLTWLIRRLNTEDQANTRLSNVKGFTANAVRTIAGSLDPIEMAMAIGTEALTLGYGTPFVVSRYGWRAKNAAMMLGGTSQAALGAGLRASHGETDPKMYAMGAAVDMTAGALGGWLMPEAGMIGRKVRDNIKANPTPEQAAASAAAEGKTLDAITAKAHDLPEGWSEGYVDPTTGNEVITTKPSAAPTESTVGAKANQIDGVYKSEGRPIPKAEQGDVPKSVFGKVRIDVVGSAGQSESPLTRHLMRHLGEDGVGLRDGNVTKLSTAEWAIRNHASVEARWNHALKPAWWSWSKDNNVGWMGRLLPSQANWERFSKDVIRYMEDETPNAHTLYHPGVVQAGNRARALLDEFAKDLQNPGLKDGRVMPSVAGAEKLQPDPHYVPKIADREAIDRMIALHGEAAVKRLIRESLERGMQQGGYKIDQDLLDRVAEGYYRNISSAAYGQHDSLAEALGRRSASHLREVMEADGGFTKDTIDRLATLLSKEDPANPRLKHRAPIDYNHSIKTQAGTISLRDMFSNDIDHILMAYSRRMSGEVAFGRLIVKDPTQPHSPEPWINGIRSRADFESKVLAAIREDHNIRNLGADAVNKAIKQAEFLWKVTHGLPQHNLSQGFVRRLRRIRDYNFLRLMSNMGWTQAIETGRIFSQYGFKAALQNMPSLRRIIDDASGDYVLKNKMARELEMWGVTQNDYWIGASKHRYQQEFTGTTPSAPTRLGSLGNKFDDAAAVAKDMLNVTSLQRPIHSRQQQWASRAAVQWFADAARDPAMFKKFAQRLADMGLNEQDLKAIREEIVKWADAPDPEKRTITAMNFEKWAPEPRAKLLDAIRRASARTVQENTPGILPMIMEHPVAKTLLQFRTFTAGSHAKSTLYHLKHHDQQALMVLIGDVAFGAGVYALRQQVASLNRNDREEFLTKELDPTHLALMGFGLSGMSSFIPMVVDSAAFPLGVEAPFQGARASGTATSAWGGLAPVDLYSTLASSVQATVQSTWQGRDMSQQEMRTIARSMPWGNAAPMLAFLNSLIQDRPLMAPKNP